MNPIESTPAAEATPLPAEVEATEEAPEAEAVAEVSTTAVRSATVAEDARLAEQAHALIASLMADPKMAVQIAENWLRDQGLESRETGALASQDIARLNEGMAEAAQAAERAARASAADANFVGQVFGWIGTAIAVAVSVVASVFTGGASLALGVAAVACMIAAQTVSVLGQEGIIDDPAVAQGLSIGLSVVATALSFGANAAGTAAQGGAIAGSLAVEVLSKAALETAREVGQVLTLGLQIGGAAVGVGTGISSMVATVEEFEASHHEIDGDRHEMTADRAREDVDEDVEGMGTIMRHSRRMAEAAARVREAESAATSAAMIRV